MKAIVLSSGGIDSTTCISMAIERYGKENVSTVSMTYGQRHNIEIESARKVAKYYEVNHYEYDLSEIFKNSNCALLGHSTDDIKEESYEKQYETGERITTYVPFRNGLMLSVVSVLAQSLYPNEKCIIVLGNHASDFAYADCSCEFVQKMNDAILEGTYGLVEFWSPLMNMSKSDVVSEGIKMGTPYEITYSCYNGKKMPCGKCASCISRKEAFEANGKKDPVRYQI